MKFTSIMRKLFVIVLLLLVGNVVLAQKTTNSPFSSFGLGEIGGLDHAVFSGVGNSTITMHDSTVLNFYNPASYNSLGKGQPIFSLGASSRLSNYSENDVTSFSSVTSIQHFAMAFPIAKHFGLAFGLKPYSRKGYEFSSRNKVDDDSLYYNYSGTGGINDVFIGFSTNILKFKGARISLGGNFGYLFGSATDTRKSGLIEGNINSNTLEEEYSGGVSEKAFHVSSFHYEIGAYYSQIINQSNIIGVSAVIDPLQKINGSYESGLYYAYDIDDPRAYDTLSYNDSLSGSLTNVPIMTFGLSYTWRSKSGRKANKLNSEVSFHATYSMSDWSKFENRFETDYVNPFLNSSKFTFGIQYIPETGFIENKNTTKFYERIRYRIGVYHFTLPYTTNGEQVTDFGTTFGFGIPLSEKKSLSSINLGFTIGNRGTADSNALKERYYGINLGFSIAPGSDRWFGKRKLN